MSAGHALAWALRGIAVLLVGAGIFEYFVLGFWMAGPFVVAALLVALSLAPRPRQRGVARAVLAISIGIPIAAVVGYAAGIVPWGVPIFDTLVFGYLATRAWPLVSTRLVTHPA